MTKCPYVPPHPWNVDFPHLMLRAKAIKYGKGEVGGGEKLLASTDVHGQLAGIPIVVQAVNAANRAKPVRKLLDATLGVHPVLARYARDGSAILSAVPSCTLMFKQELPLMSPEDADVSAVQAAMFDPFEYLVARHRDDLRKTDFKAPLGKVSYHVPCHGRVQKVGRKTEAMFKLIGKTVSVELTTVERCSGYAGTYGVKTPTHPLAMKIGKPVFKAMAAPAPAFISSDRALAGHHIAQGMGDNGLAAEELRHPLSLMRLAHGLASSPIGGCAPFTSAVT